MDLALLGMEQLPPVALYGAAAIIIVLSLVMLRVISNTFSGKAPPVEEGIPFIGGILMFAKGPMYLMDKCYKKHGEVFTVPVAHKKITFLIGPHASPTFFKGTDDDMSQEEVYSYSVRTFGKGVVFDIPQSIRNEHFKVFSEGLRSQRLKVYIPAFKQEAMEHFKKWSDTGDIDLNDEYSQLILCTASRTLLGREVREQMFKEVADLLHELDKGMIPISVIAPWLPIEAHRKRDVARKELGVIFEKVIEARRSSDVKEPDLLQTFVDARYEKSYGGRPWNTDEITGNLVATIFAGQHTSNITSAWTSYYLIQNQDCWARAVEEQREIMKKHGEDISYEALNDMHYLHACMNEALRLHPPLIMLLRMCCKPFSTTTSDGKQYVVPKGHIVATSPAFSHRLGHVFKDPSKFNPSRFLPPLEEDKKQNFAFIGFGAGRHGCMGSNFAYLQVKTVLSIVLRNYEFQFLSDFPEPDYSGMVVGPTPARVRYTKRPLQ